MNHLRPILRDSALLIAPLAGLGAWLGGAWMAVGVVVAGLVSLGNLALLGWIVGKLATAMEAEGDASAAAPAGALAFKSLLALGVYGGLMFAFDPLAIALGLGAVVLGVCIRGLLLSVNPAPSGYGASPAPPDPQIPQES